MIAAIDPAVQAALVMAIVGLMAQAWNVYRQADERRQRRHAEEIAGAASSAAVAADTKANMTEAVLHGWETMVTVLNQRLDAQGRELADVRERLTLAQASNDRCHEERAQLRERVAQLEKAG